MHAVSHGQHSPLNSTSMRLLVRLNASLILLAASLSAHAEIYKCADEDGNVSYQQTPCPVRKTDEAPASDEEGSQIAEPVEDDYVPESTPEPRSAAERVPSSRQPGESLNDCKKRYRDQIDEIDAEMRTSFSAEEGAAYKENLLALTKQLRACSTEPSDAG